jgi:hypothetical protein
MKVRHSMTNSPHLFRGMESFPLGTANGERTAPMENVCCGIFLAAGLKYSVRPSKIDKRIQNALLKVNSRSRR